MIKYLILFFTGLGLIIFFAEKLVKGAVGSILAFPVQQRHHSPGSSCEGWFCGLDLLPYRLPVYSGFNLLVHAQEKMPRWTGIIFISLYLVSVTGGFVR